MTVKKLIEKLQTLDPNIHVFTKGYEGGCEDLRDDLETIKPVEIALNVHTDWYYGPHEEVSELYDKEKFNYKIVNGIIL